MSLLFDTFFAYPLYHWVLASLCIIAATCVQYGLGIAFGLIAAPLLALINIEFVPAPILILTCITATSSVMGERGLIIWPQVAYSVSGRILGSMFAILILSLIPSEKAFMLLFGAIIAIAVLLSVSGLNLAFKLPVIGAAGIVSGVTATITGVGGPPMALVYQNQNAKDVRATLQMFFALGSASSFALLYVSGYVVARDVFISVCLLPAFFIGFLLGPKTRPLFDRNFKKLLLLSAAISSVLLIAKGLS